MTNRQKTIGELLNTGEVGRDALLELGYNRVDFEYVHIKENGEVLYRFYLVDDFQSELDHTAQESVGFQTIDGDNLLESISRWPNRAMREIMVLAKQMGKLGHAIEHIQDLQVKAFVQRLQPDIEKLRAQIVDQRGRG